MKNKREIFVPVILGILVSIMLIIILKVFVFERLLKNDNRMTTNDVSANEPNINENNSETQGAQSNQVSMIFGGDFLLSNEMLNAYNKNGEGLKNIMSEDLQKEFKDADIAMVNNEFPYSNRGTQAQDKQYTFRADPSNVKILNEMGVDIVSLANNHALDFGVDALIDSMEALKGASILYGGAGNNLDEAKEIKYIEKNNKKVAFLCATRVIPVSEWNATDDRAGLFTTYDSRNLVTQLAKKYIDAGADMVIGAHSHCLQGMEVYNGKLITYSLGNFIFNGRYNKTMALKAIINEDNSIKAQFIPCESSSYKTYIAEDSKAQEIRDYYKSISFDIDMDEEGYININ